MPRLFTFIAVLLVGVTRPVQADELRVYFGNLHSHTSYSDGSGLPHQAYRHARDAAKLDFFAVTEHNHKDAELGAGDRRDGILIANDHSLYNGADRNSVIESAKHFTKDGSFIALYGQEFSSIGKGNHVCVLDAPEVIDVPNGRFDLLLKWVESHHDTTDQPCIIQLNHPKLGTHPKLDYGRDDFKLPGDSQAMADQRWIEHMGRACCVIEILNGPAMTHASGERAAEKMETQFIKYLGLGFKVAPTADQDNHYETWGTATDARTGVIIEGPITKPKLLAALRARHVYGSEDQNLRAIFHVNGHLCGEDIVGLQPNTVVSIEATITDDDEPHAGYDVDVFRGNIGGPAATSIETVSIPAGNEPFTIDDIRYTGGRQFVFFRITQLDEDGQEDKAWTSPVWFEPVTPSPAVAAEPTGPRDLVLASKRSNVFHTSADCEFSKKIQDHNRVTGEEAKEGRRQCHRCRELAEGSPTDGQ